ncbi:MAG TPA: RNA 2',3'-cyclic phosphodiesterase [Bacteroidales bacterium]|nr:RNA 2',3'-cyclic phosphodiesterase [Bacteroidales bacterium]HSA42240.1 RNA 2',3'-cyclic phosphodiesterase [Bacteroidales bacterium]
MRLFLAIRIEPEATLLAVMQAIQQELKHERIKWVENHNLHVTLWFLGETDESDLPFIRNEMLKAAAEIPPFTFLVKDCGTFGKARNPTVIWLGLQLPEPMMILHKRISNVFNDKESKQEAAAFTPHLTIGRIKQAVDATQLRNILKTFSNMVFQECTATGFTLYRSHLTPAGPHYEALYRFDFQDTSFQT